MAGLKSHSRATSAPTKGSRPGRMPATVETMEPLVVRLSGEQAVGPILVFLPVAPLSPEERALLSGAMARGLYSFATMLEEARRTGLTSGTTPGKGQGARRRGQRSKQAPGGS